MTKPISPEQLLSQLNWRYATKLFDPARRISPEEWAALEASLLLSPSSYGLQPWQFLVVNDPALRAQLVPVSNDQRQIVDASHLVVFAVKTNIDETTIDAHLTNMAQLRGVALDSYSVLREKMIKSIMLGRNAAQRIDWAARQAYLALGTFLNSAALLGIDTCPMEGMQPARYDEMLGLANLNLKTVVAATAGYRSATDKYATLPKVRFPKTDVIRYL